MCTCESLQPSGGERRVHSVTSAVPVGVPVGVPLSQPECIGNLNVKELTSEDRDWLLGTNIRVCTGEGPVPRSGPRVTQKLFLGVYKGRSLWGSGRTDGLRHRKL
ncbi:hypothetical protein EYF80_028016 [Liparis tanakae]|uniref:Uncharacterized protein n=1 Tax=Liparis tanakae TaxID=230148 RepID=A0A4Z2HA83_9TELE|nr:hypothetical protein EYF80_028016 [Liparis tanakae]